MSVFVAMLRDDTAESIPHRRGDGPEINATDYHRYQRGNFVALLPSAYLYTPGHAWLAPGSAIQGKCWRVGLTKFALRMLGELVEIQFSLKPGDPIQPGDILGTIEGFKALSELYSSGRGLFAGGNPALATGLGPVLREPHGQGWLYSFEGEPGPESLDIGRYCQVLDQTIDRLQARDQQQEGTS